MGQTADRSNPYRLLNAIFSTGTFSRSVLEYKFPACTIYIYRLTAFFSMCNCGFAAGILHEVSCLLLIYFRQPESKKICSMLVHQLTKNQAPHSMSFTETLHKTLLLEPNCGHRFEQNLVDTVVDFASKVSPDFHSLELHAMCKFSMLVVGIPKQLSVTGRSGTKLLSKPAVGLSGQANDGDLTVSLYIRKVDICVWFFCL